MFAAFQEEASAFLRYVYSRHEIARLSTRELVLSKFVKVGPMINEEVSVWLKLLRRRMMPSPRARNPWFIELKRGLLTEIYSLITEAVLASPSMFGIAIEGKAIKFTNKNRLVRDFSYLAAAQSSGYSRAI